MAGIGTGIRTVFWEKGMMFLQTILEGLGHGALLVLFAIDKVQNYARGENHLAFFMVYAILEVFSRAFRADLEGKVF